MHIKWCSIPRATGGPAKAAVIMFSLHNHLTNKPMPPVNFCGDNVETVSVKYLDIRFDCSVGFKEHVDHIKTKARKGIAAIKIRRQQTLSSSCLSF